MMLFKEYRIKDLFNIYSGATPSSKVGSYWDGDITWVTPADMSDFGFISNGENCITQSGYESCGTTIVPEGSIILSSRAPIGKINITASPMCTNQGCKSLVPKNDTVNMKYVAYYLLNNVNDIDSLGQGTTFKELPLKRISSYQILLPSFKVQQRIVDYLDEKASAIDTKIELLEKKKDAYIRIKKATINRAVTRGLDEHVKMKDSGVEWIGMIPEHWKVKRIKDVVDVMFMGKTPEYEYEEENDCYVFGQKNNQLNGIDFDGIKFAQKEFFYERSDYEFLKYGDVLLNTLGGGSVGRTGYYDYIGEKRVITDGHILVMRSNNYCTKYLYYFLSSKRYELELMAIGSTNQSFFNQSDIRDLFVPEPTLSEQQTIAAYLDEKCAMIDATISNIDKQIEALKRLKRSLIKEVITGQRAV